MDVGVVVGGMSERDNVIIYAFRSVNELEVVCDAVGRVASRTMSTCSNFVLREGGSKRCFRNCMLQFCRELVVGGPVVCLLQGVAEGIKGFIRCGAVDISNDEEGGNGSDEQYGEGAYRDLSPGYNDDTQIF